MFNKHIVFFLLSLFLSLSASSQNRQDARSQASIKNYQDSLREARQKSLDSAKAARIHYFDSLKTARKHVLDSTIASRKLIQDSILKVRQRRTDSLNTIRKYKESRRYRDSVARVKQNRIDSIKAVRMHFLDSVKAERKRVLDSTILFRKHITDSVKAIQKRRTDSLAVIRKYKESKRYADSIKVIRQSRLDSIRLVRKKTSDSLIADRKKKLEELNRIRKMRTDSMAEVRKIRTDSLLKVRQRRTDSLTKLKEINEKQKKAEQKKREEKMKMQLELKIRKKQDAWTNEKMLKKRWGFVRRSTQNLYTRDNYYFNARNKLHEAEQNMLRRNKDNYEQRIPLFPFDPNKDSTVFSSDMDSIIAKSSIGIQIHDPRTRWADDLYLLMGEAYYYKGAYNKADEVFKYIIGMENRIKKKKKKKKKDNEEQFVKKEKSALAKLFSHRPAHNDAILWLTRSLTTSNKGGDAEAILDLLDASQKLSERMKAKVALERANLHLSKKEDREAIPQLAVVAQSKTVNKVIRQRASFLHGQLLYGMGMYDSAAHIFKNNVALHPPLEMDFYARKYRAEAIAQTNGQQDQSIASLKHLLKDAKYAPYHEQVYYILGKLSARNDNNTEAIEYYKKSLLQSKTTPKQKAITFASMGNIQYKMGEYSQAKRSYDSASYFAKNIKDNPELDMAFRRSKSLDRIEQPYYTIKDQDSLLILAAMNEKEQRSVARKYLKYLEKLKEDSAYNAQQAAQAGSLGAGTSGSSTGSGSGWYFSSQSAVQQGYSEFKRKWGNRPLADNWRRASASAFGSQNNTATEAGTDNEGEEESDEITEESLLKAIPKTAEQIAAVKNKLQKAYVDLASVYIKDLDEYQEGLNLLDTLQKRFPDHPYGAEVLYLRYTAALRTGKMEEAEQVRNGLLSSFPNSEFTKLTGAANTNEQEQNTKTEDIAGYYETTYLLSQEGRHMEVVQRTNTAKRVYGDKNYARKFQVLEASSLTALGEYKKADTLVKAYLKENPSDSLKPWLDAIQKKIAELKAADTLASLDTVGNKLKSAGTIKDSSASLARDTTGLVTKDKKVAAVNNEFVYDVRVPHYCVFIFGKPEVREAAFRSGLEEYNKLKFGGLQLKAALQMLNASQSLVIVQPFQSAGQAKIYMNNVKKESILFRDFSNEKVEYFIISESNFEKLKKDKKVEEYQNFYKKHYK